MSRDMTRFVTWDLWTRRSFFARTLLFVGVLGVTVESAMLWFEQAPQLDDPCTIVVVSKQYEMAEFHPPTNCHKTSVAWFASYGRIHLWLHYGKKRNTVQEFAICLTAGSPDRVYVWWDTNRDSWSPISFPLWHGEVPKRDSCRKSVNGTMNLYLEPPWSFPQYMAHVTWNVTLLDGDEYENYDDGYDRSPSGFEDSNREEDEAAAAAGAGAAAAASPST